MEARNDSNKTPIRQPLPMKIHCQQQGDSMGQFFHRSRRLFLLFTIVLYSSTALVFGETKVFILAGQSNMQGAGKVNELGSLTPYTYQFPYLTPMDGISAFHRNSQQLQVTSITMGNAILHD